jgi:hypothetical protein
LFPVALSRPFVDAIALRHPFLFNRTSHRRKLLFLEARTVPIVFKGAVALASGASAASIFSCAAFAVDISHGFLCFFFLLLLLLLLFFFFYIEVKIIESR